MAVQNVITLKDNDHAEESLLSVLRFKECDGPLWVGYREK
jgi:hypothetical protein